MDWIRPANWSDLAGSAYRRPHPAAPEPPRAAIAGWLGRMACRLSRRGRSLDHRRDCPGSSSDLIGRPALGHCSCCAGQHPGRLDLVGPAVLVDPAGPAVFVDFAVPAGFVGLAVPAVPVALAAPADRPARRSGDSAAAAKAIAGAPVAALAAAGRAGPAVR